MADYRDEEEYEASSWDPEAPFEDVEDEEVATAYCPECKAEVYVDVDQCPYCQAYITPTTNVDHASFRGVGRQVVVWLLIVALVGVTLLGVRWF